MRRALILVSLAALAFGALPASAGPNREPGRPFGPPSSGCSEPGSGTAWALAVGAYGLARQGWGPSKILKHFYSGTRVDREGSPPKNLRIGLAQGEQSIRLEAEAGAVEIRLGDPTTGPKIATIPSGETWAVRAAGNEYLIMDGTGATVDSVGGPTDQIFVVYESLDSRVRIPEAARVQPWVHRGSICTRATAAGV